jgi:hypothetical protein
MLQPPFPEPRYARKARVSIDFEAPTDVTMNEPSAGVRRGLLAVPRNLRGQRGGTFPGDTARGHCPGPIASTVVPPPPIGEAVREPAG